MKKFGVKEVVATGIGAALVFVLLRYVAIPTPIPDTTLSIQNGVIAFFAVLFGPVVGFLVGFIGNLLVDLTAGWGIWWSWIMASGLFGLVVGFGTKDFSLKDGVFGKKEIIRMNIFNVAGAVIAWGIVAPIGDIIFYAEPAAKVFLQGLTIGLVAVIVVATVGTVLCKAYASSNAKKGSLSREE